MIVGLCKLELFFPEVHSLKEKRMILNSLKEKTFRQFKIPVREVDHQDLWQRTAIGFAVVGNDEKEVASLVDKMIQHLERLAPGEVTNRLREILHFE